MTDVTRLLGAWTTDPTDTWSLDEYGRVSLFFGADGVLVYTIHLADRVQVMRLTYELRGDKLLTNQPSAPREEISRISFGADGCLVVHNPSPSPPTRYVRGLPA